MENSYVEQNSSARLSIHRCTAKLKGSGFLINLKNTANLLSTSKLPFILGKKISGSFRSGKIAKIPGGLIAKITSTSLF